MIYLSPILAQTIPALEAAKNVLQSSLDQYAEARKYLPLVNDLLEGERAVKREEVLSIINSPNHSKIFRDSSKTDPYKALFIAIILVAIPNYAEYLGVSPDSLTAEIHTLSKEGGEIFFHFAKSKEVLDILKRNGIIVTIKDIKEFLGSPERVGKFRVLKNDPLAVEYLISSIRLEDKYLSQS